MYHSGGSSRDTGFATTLGDPTSAGQKDIVYTTTVNVGGVDILVQLDTGSSDLWIYSPDPQPKLTNTTSFDHANMTYGIGSVAGRIDFAEVEVGPYTIPSQAFLNVNASNDMALYSIGVYGILGLAFDQLSGIASGLEEVWGSQLGATVLTQIFRQNTSQPNFISFLAGRTTDLESPYNGTFTISEYAPGYEKVAETPKLPVVLPSASQTDLSPRWNILLDGLTVNGKSFDFKKFNSSNPSTPKGKAMANLDTGYTFGPVAKETLDFMYSGIPGALYSESDSQWILPCMSTADISFTFSGQEIRLHPLDVSSPQVLQPPNGTNITVCQSQFVAGDTIPGIDLLLGDAFLRNVYAIFDFGDYVREDTLNVTDPYIQLLATTTDLTEAKKDFEYSRAKALESLPPAISPAQYLALVKSLQSGNDSSSGDSEVSVDGSDAQVLNAESSSGSSSAGWTVLADKFDHYGSALVGLLAVNLLIGVILCAIGFTMCIRRGAKQGTPTRAINPSYVPVRLPKADDNEYHPESFRD
ncbi:acid protease [Neolentinus lepideus HHB14362 ss-1]|uniref:Acid protease n=1 Tax=Neolentinus lepideus HHB14362 ss-1 TaxID=1314782 RepID=A0A165PIK9_9AGAM|nr:acid protease [Neolentinus lepideus HHB14362 ss-1]